MARSESASSLDNKYADSLAHLSVGQAGRQPALAQHFGKRYHAKVEDSKAAGSQNDTSGAAVPNELQCKRCGILAVPGWSGSMQLARLDDGKIGRKRKLKDERVSAQVTNKLLWTCQCGWQSIMPGPSPTSKKQFKRRKVTDRISQNIQADSVVPSLQSTSDVEVASPASPLPVTETMSSKEASPMPQLSAPESATSILRTSGTSYLLGSPSPSANNVTSPTEPVQQPRFSADSAAKVPFDRKSRGVTLVSAGTPAQTQVTSAAAAQPSKKKRGKREGLQAMLAAKKENELKESKTSGLGLSSFLQGLQ